MLYLIFFALKMVVVDKLRRVNDVTEIENIAKGAVCNKKPPFVY